MADGENADMTLTLDGIPFSVFVIMCALAMLGVIYAMAILVFNVLKQKDKVMKMTSPNINVVILLGACLAYSSMVLLGMDASMVSLDTMAKLLQASSYVLAFSFSLVYGSVFSKAWRVFMIFKNINFNGKNTRDEHLLVAVLVLLLVDLVILLPWTLTDPIHCHYITVSTSNNASMALESGSHISQMPDCASDLQVLWVSLLYAFKLSVLIIGLYFTWQTRHVTLASLQDTKQTYIVVYTVVVLGLMCLPVLLMQRLGIVVRYVTGAMATWVVATVTITLLFVPKILLWRREQMRDSPDAFRFQFTESMKKTQEAVRKCSFCFCCEPQEDEDKYATEVLTNEIETLKRSNKEKDATIRELTDRLYFGTEKFQQYLTSPKRPSSNSVLQAMHRKHVARTKSQPYLPTQEEDGLHHHTQNFCPDLSARPTRGKLRRARTEDESFYPSDESFDQHMKPCEPETMQPSVAVVNAGPVYPQQIRDPQYSQKAYAESQALTQHRLAVPNGRSVKRALFRTPSPNHDSAIDNNSPSTTDSSERGSYNELKPVPEEVTSQQRPRLLRAQTLPPSSHYDHPGHMTNHVTTPAQVHLHEAIDIEAMESDATSKYWPDGHNVENGYSVHDSQPHHQTISNHGNRAPLMHNSSELIPYRTKTVDGVAVSQI